MAHQPVLIVDDNPANLKVARVALETYGFQVRTASDGEEALVVLGEFRPLLILMDIQLPGIDGLELTKRLKADPATRDIKIVAVTAYAMKGDREKALAAGCDGYIAKPLDPILLPEQVTAYLASAPEKPQVVKQPAALRESTSGKGLVLLVEDNPVTAKMIRIALQSDGYEVMEAGTGRAALTAVMKRLPDLIIQDLILPDIDGLELLRQMRERLPDFAVPILCITGLLSRVDEARALEGGFSAVLVKPVDPFELLDTVRAQLATASAYPPGAGQRVLVVDDDPMQLKYSRAWLTQAGFRVVAAGDGALALELARRERPDVILSDVLMPLMDGFELCLVVRRDPDLTTIPVVLVTASHADDVERGTAARVGASVLLSKSDPTERIGSALTDAIARGAPPAPVERLNDFREERSRKGLWQLERAAQQSSTLAQRCTMQAAQLSVLAGVTEALAQRRDLDAALADILAACLDMAGISKGALYLADVDGHLVLQHQIGFTEIELPRVRGFFGRESLFHEVMERGRLIAAPAPESPIPRTMLEQAGVNSMLIVPVVWAGELYGAFLLATDRTDAMQDDLFTFARVLGGQIGQAIGLTRAFRGLSANEERFRSVVQSMDDTVFILNLKGQVTDVYGGAAVRGMDPREVIGKTLDEALGPVNGRTHLQAHEEAVRGKSSVYEWQLEGGNGSLHFQTAVSPIRHDGDTIVGTVRVTRDITEQKRLQAQLMLSDRLVSVGTLAAGVAHEINNPLTAVIGNLDLAAAVLEEQTDGEKAKDLLEFMTDARSAAQRVRDIVRDLKVFSRAEEDARSAVDVHEVLESSLRIAWNELRHRATVTKDFGTVPRVTANEGRLGQVFLNLLINAAQAIPEGSAHSNQIRLKTYTDPHGQAVAEVSDTGSGIPAEVMEKVFTPFFTTKPVGVGTGLGLAICQRIVADLGGEISAHSTPGVGTTFRITLPAATIAPGQSAPAQPSIRSFRHGEILVIDDDEFIATTVRRMLSAEHSISTMTDAREALRVIGEGRTYDLILCDLMMPIMTGMEFFRQLSAVAPELADHVVFLTGGAFTHSARTFLDTVPNRRVDKPFNVRELRSLVNELIG